MPLSMPGRAQAKARAVTEASLEKKELCAKATKLYLEQESLPVDERMSARTVCETISKQHFEDTGRLVNLSKTTLLKHSKGGRTTWEYHEEMLLVSSAEARVLIDYIIEMAD